MTGSLYSVIVNWNLEDDTLVRVNSLFTADAKDRRVIVADNGSGDGFMTALQKRGAVKSMELAKGH